MIIYRIVLTTTPLNYTTERMSPPLPLIQSQGYPVTPLRVCGVAKSIPNN